jgi:hypothetical protein
MSASKADLMGDLADQPAVDKRSPCSRGVVGSGQVYYNATGRSGAVHPIPLCPSGSCGVAKRLERGCTGVGVPRGKPNRVGV